MEARKVLPRIPYLYLLLAVLNFTKHTQAYESKLLHSYNDKLREFNHLGAELAWKMSTNLDNFTEILGANEKLILKKNLWNNDWCIRLLNKKWQKLSDLRQVYLICRGPRFSSYQLSNLLSILGTLRKTYDTRKICLSDGKCYRMEPDLNNLMEKTHNEKTLYEVWSKWHMVIGQELSEPYSELVKMLNIGARQAGRSDIGSCWREEMETENLKDTAINLYSRVKHLFSLLHAFVRFHLEKYYNIDLKKGDIPAHLLGNMWGQRWDNLIDIIWPVSREDETENDYVRHSVGKDAGVPDMVEFADEFYMKMGFPSLPPKFYSNSYFESNSTNVNCHGSAANMFENRDYRIMMCASPTDADLQELIHEVGHIHYFMAYEKLPTIFQDGANAAFHEAVGDAVTYGMHPNPSIRTLLKMGLFKLPQIAFGLVVDLWRWKVFDTEDDVRNWNKLWWEINHEYLGVRVPDDYKSEGLDALGKYHIVDNIPYIRYFFASFLQHMFYNAMCEGEQYCTLENRGARFRKMLSRGSSVLWSTTLEEFTGFKEISASPLLDYYKPLETFLEYEIQKNNIPVGW